MLTMLERDQAEIRRIIVQSRALLAERGDAASETITDLRWQFNRAITRHIFTLSNDVPQWASRVRPEAASTVSLVAEAAVSVRQAYETHRERFKAAEVQFAWEDYAASSARLMQMLEDLFDAERADLFPLIAQTD